MKRKLNYQNNSRKIKVLEPPPINSLDELIQLGNTFKFYKNINNGMLWRILPYLEELNAMVGMASLKSSIFYQVIYYLQGLNNTYKGSNEDYLHTAIYGPAGCGKTTVAKIIGKIYKGLNILSENSEFKMATRDTFLAGYLGQTALKTKKFLDECKGHCLFIDEVYSLAPRDGRGDSFSKEAIDTLNLFLSENKSNFCCIIAGYEDEVKNSFFKMNRGLERRFPWIHRIETYTAEDLSKIFTKLVRNSGWFHNLFESKVTELIKSEKEKFKNGGGSIETFITSCKLSHAKRVFTQEIMYKYVLTEEDLKEALKQFGKVEVVKGPPMGMYI